MNQDEEYKSDVIADQAGAELAELRAENERLRKALKDINITACYGWRDAEEALAKIATDAADALSPSTDESEPIND